MACRYCVSCVRFVICSISQSPAQLPNGQCLQSHWSDIEHNEAITETLGENFTASLEGFCVHIST